MERRTKIQYGFMAMFLLFVWAGFQLLYRVDNSYPEIHGRLIPQGRQVEPFLLLNHFDQPFTNHDLMGKWHLVSYGYTHCPDICPNTLQVLTRFKKRLQSQPQFSDLQVLFYSIDPERDTVELLYQYMPFFHSTFIGLTYDASQQSQSVAFEKSLGIKAVLTPLADDEKNQYTGDYSVSHGVMLYLINPKGELQAVFKPLRSKEGIQFFREEKLLSDYLAVRKYFG